KQGESLAGKKDHAGAAAAYLRAAREFPKDERAAKACVNAVVEAKLAGDLGLAKEGADVAIRDHEGAPEAAQAVAAMSEALRLAGLLSEAAGYDEAIVAKYPKDARARDASYNAVVARTALGDYDRAVKDAGDYLRLYGSASADDADEVTFLLGKAHERAKHFSDAEKLYSGYSSRAKNLDHKIEALVRLALVRVELKDRAGADRALESAVKLGHEHQKSLKEGKTHAAHARYLQGEQIVGQYDAVTLDASGNELKKRLDKKKELLKRAAGIFADCAKMGSGEWATAALYRIGYVFEGFANALKTAQPPAGVKAEDAEAFRQIVDPIAEQFLEKAIDAYENGWKKAVELKIFNKWTADMRAALARLSDVAYPPLREQGIETRTVGPAPLPAPIDAPVVAPKPVATTTTPAATAGKK
ncbi:MAG: tol-pal system YbgF family protein, partial [Polyangiales bacterium]